MCYICVYMCYIMCYICVTYVLHMCYICVHMCYICVHMCYIMCYICITYVLHMCIIIFLMAPLTPPCGVRWGSPPLLVSPHRGTQCSSLRRTNIFAPCDPAIEPALLPPRNNQTSAPPQAGLPAGSKFLSSLGLPQTTFASRSWGRRSD